MKNPICLLIVLALVTCIQCVTFAQNDKGVVNMENLQVVNKTLTKNVQLQKGVVLSEIPEKCPPLTPKPLPPPQPPVPPSPYPPCPPPPYVDMDNKVIKVDKMKTTHVVGLQKGVSRQLR